MYRAIRNGNTLITRGKVEKRHVANAIEIDVGPPRMRDVPHGIMEKLKFVRQMGDRSCANAIDVNIGPPKMREVSHGILKKLNNMR